jgi:hypothetical protein
VARKNAKNWCLRVADFRKHARAGRWQNVPSNWRKGASIGFKRRSNCCRGDVNSFAFDACRLDLLRHRYCHRTNFYFQSLFWIVSSNGHYWISADSYHVCRPQRRPGSRPNWVPDALPPLYFCYILLRYITAPCAGDTCPAQADASSQSNNICIPANSLASFNSSKVFGSFAIFLQLILPILMFLKKINNCAFAALSWTIIVFLVISACCALLGLRQIETCEDGAILKSLSDPSFTVTFTTLLLPGANCMIAAIFFQFFLWMYVLASILSPKSMFLRNHYDLVQFYLPFLFFHFNARYVQCYAKVESPNGPNGLKDPLNLDYAKA